MMGQAYQALLTVGLGPGRGPGSATGALVPSRFQSNQVAVTAAPAPTIPTPAYIQRAIGENSVEAREARPFPVGSGSLLERARLVDFSWSVTGTVAVMLWVSVTLSDIGKKPEYPHR